jgi:26S proteasome regulatory subunit N1
MGVDSLMVPKEVTDSPWIYKVKNEGLIAAAASLGMIYLWDPEGGSNHINEYLDL